MSFDRTSDRELEDYLTTLTRRAGGCLSADAAGCLLGISQRAVDDRRQTKTLLAIPDAGGWAYPCAQFHGNRTIPGLAEVVQGLEVSGPWVTRVIRYNIRAVESGRKLSASQAEETG